jgi:hypothetical protein
MSNEQIFQQVRYLLQRNLTPEEHKFLSLASQTIGQGKEQPPKMATGKPKVAKIAV